MSVAFRRESDEEHLEPSFELPVPPGPNFVTPRGLHLIEKKVEEFEGALTDATDDEERKSLARDLRYWRARLASAQVAPLASGDAVAIGTRVTYERGGESRTVEIVGHDEAEPASGRVSFAAPLIKVMLGAEVDDVVEFGADEITVLAITSIA